VGNARMRIQCRAIREINFIAKQPYCEESFGLMEGGTKKLGESQWRGGVGVGGQGNPPRFLPEGSQVRGKLGEGR